MEIFERRSEMPVSADALWRWHARPGAFARLAPPWDPPELVAMEGPFAEARVEIAMRVGPVPVRWVARHHDCVEGERFSDRQEQGPFAAWDHTHSFTPITATTSLLIDHVAYALPLGAVGHTVAARSIAGELDRMFQFRHQRTREDLMRHDGIAPLRIAVTGASGLLGSQLVPFLTTGGHRVHRLVRGAAKDGEIHWDPAKGELDAAALEGVDAVIHLAGENVGQRWTPERKRRVMDSRVKGTRLISEAIARLSRRPKVFVSASAIGWYGVDRGDEVLDESSGPGTGFLSEVCRAWEQETAPAVQAGIRTVNARIGVILSARGGALGQMLTPFRLGAGGPIGSGRQWFSWIAMDDVLGALLHLLASDRLSGPVNLCSPNPVTQADFARTLGKVLHRPAAMPLPAFMVRALFGEMGTEVLLGGQRVLPRRLLDDQFLFLQPHLEGALAFELGVTTSA